MENKEINIINKYDNINLDNPILENQPQPRKNLNQINTPYELYSKVSYEEVMEWDNVPYNLKIGLDRSNSKIIFYMEQKSNLCQEFYHASLDLQDSYSLGRYFRICINIQEVLNGILAVYQGIKEDEGKKKGYSVSLSMDKNQNFAYLKYSGYTYIESKEKFEIKLEKIDKDKDIFVNKLRDYLNKFECNWLKKEYQNESQQQIVNIFNQIHKQINLSGKDIIEETNTSNFISSLQRSIGELTKYVNNLFINYTKFKFKWKGSSDNNYYVKDNSKLIKSRANNVVVIGEKLPKNKICEWEIKIVSSSDREIAIGVAPCDIDLSNSDYNSGWCYYCSKSLVYLKGKEVKYANKVVKNGDIIGVRVNTLTNELRFSLNGEDLGLACDNLVTDFDIVPAVFMMTDKESVELLD